MYKQQPRSPLAKALKGNQNKLPQQLQEAIKAAPESPAKQTKRVNPSSLDKKTVNSARQMLKKSGINDPNLTDAQVIKAAKGKGVYADARSEAKQGLKQSAKSYEYGSPAKQVTAGEFAHQKSLKDKEMGKSTKTVDKVKAAYKAATTDQTYAGAKKEYRKVQKKKYAATNSPAKVKDPVTGTKVKGYAKSDLKVDRVRDKQERKAVKSEKLATAKSDGKVTRLERKGIKNSQANLKNEQVAKRNNKFQEQKAKDKVSKENTKLRVKNKKLSDAVAVGYDAKKANTKMAKATDRANKKIAKAKVKAAKRSF